MQPKHLGIVWNPSKTTREELEQALDSASLTSSSMHVDWFETSEDDPGRAATRRAVEAGASVILAAGGDGTVRAVAEHLAETGAPAELAIIPLGTGNLLARNLNVPLNDRQAAFQRALTGTGKPLDIGWVQVDLPSGQERYAFAVMAGFGIDAHMISETDDDLKSKAGWLAYVESLGRAISASEVIEVRLAIDDAEAEPARAHTIIIGNCGTLQGGVTLLPDADPADGKLDLLALHEDGVAGWAGTLSTMVWDNGLKRLLSKERGDEAAVSDGTTTHRQISSVSIELDEARAFEVDGDEVGEVTRLEVHVQPAAIRVR